MQLSCEDGTKGVKKEVHVSDSVLTAATPHRADRQGARRMRMVEIAVLPDARMVDVAQQLDAEMKKESK